jgi:hypothetical protein
VNEVGKACSTNGEQKNAYRILIVKPEDNIKTYLREIGLCSRDWIDLAQDRDQWRALVNKEMSIRVP